MRTEGSHGSRCLVFTRHRYEIHRDDTAEVDAGFRKLPFEEVASGLRQILEPTVWKDEWLTAAVAEELGKL